MRRSFRISAGSIGTALLCALAACGTPDSSTADATGGSSDQAPSASGGVATDAGSPSVTTVPFPAADRLVGTFRASDGATTISATWHVGAPLPGSPSGEAPAAIPADAVAACGADTTIGTATSVFIPAQLDVAYEQGSLPEVVVLVPNELTLAGIVGFDIDGGWQCDVSGALPVTVQAGETRTLTAVVIEQVLSNERPTLTPEAQNALAFDKGGIGFGDLPFNTKVTTTGPGALCPTDTGFATPLLMYATELGNFDC